MQFRAAVLALLLTLFCLPHSAQAQKRMALVIGNSAYAHVSKLVNPANDAPDIAAALERLGFDVTRHQDLTGEAMRRALRNFSRKSHGAEMALIYFAGHGIEVNRQNYLVPVDAELKSNLDISFEAVRLDQVMSAVSGARTLRLVLLDACRNNPFLANMTIADNSRSIGRGLARVEPQVGTLVGYAAKEGTTAADGKGRNSPYTKALLAHLEQPGLEVQFLFRQVRDSVIEQTNGRQEPFTYGSLPGKRLYLKAPAPDAPKVSKAEADRLAWAAVRDTTDTGMIRQFILRNPDNAYADKARQRIRELDDRRAREKQALREEIAWSLVKDSTSPSQLRQFLTQFKGGKFIDQARGRIAALEADIRDEAEKRERAERVRKVAMTSAWQFARSSRDPSVLETFIAQYPEGPLADKARQRIAELKAAAKLAALEPQAETPAQDSAEAPLSGEALVTRIQSELNRVGCNAGPADGKWGRGSRGALEAFGKHGNVQLASLEPSQDVLDELIRRKSRVCPLTCSRRHVQKNGRCVLKSCSGGQILDRAGNCVAKRDKPEKSKSGKKKARVQGSSRSGGKQCGWCGKRNPNSIYLCGAKYLRGKSRGFCK